MLTDMARKTNTSRNHDAERRATFARAAGVDGTGHDGTGHDSESRATMRGFRRNSDLTASTLDVDKRQVQSILTTEDPALVYDYRTGRVVLEVLLMAGCEYESQTPLIRDHNQYSVTSIVGSVSDHTVEKDAIVGWLRFGQDLDDTAEGIWKRVAQGHLRRVSVGYDYSTADFVTIAAGETAIVAGRSFTAPKDRDLRVVKKWRLREVSLVVVPADPRAQLRGTVGNEPTDSINDDDAPPNLLRSPNSGEDTMKKFLQWLHKHGLAQSVTDVEQALRWAADGNLTEPQLDEFARVCAEDEQAFDRGKATAKRAVATGGTGGNTGSGHDSESRATNPVDATRAAADAVAAERGRVSGIRALHAQHPDVPAAVVTQAESEGWDLARTQSEFLTALRGARQPGVAPAGHIRGSEQINLRVLQAALLEREGITPDSPVFAARCTQSIGRRRELRSDWMVGVPSAGQRRDDMEQAFDIARQRGLGNITLMRAAELLGELETGERLHDEQEILERAFSSGGFSAVFGAVVHLQMLASYAATPATYQQFCEVLEVSDLREHKDADMGAVGRLKKQGKNGGKAALLNVDDPTLVAITAERYAGILKVTDQTIINDSFGVTGMLPRELGETCQQMPIDLAFAQVLRTDNLADGRQRYNVTDGNTISVATLTEAALTSLGVALKAKKVGDRRIVVNGSALVAGVTQAPNVRKLMNTQQTDSGVNPHYGSYGVVEDTAIDLGVDDPAQNDAVIAGTPNNVYAFAGGSKRSVAVAFRRGTNMGPVTRSGMLTEGEWGMYWDVFMDVGAAFRRRTGTVRVVVTG
jgi:hypothetical protein